MAKDTEKDIGKAYIKNVRLSYPHLAKPHASVKDGPLKFRATFLMDPSAAEGKKAIAVCKKAAEAICQEA
ncbi:MAG: ssDNA-binding protein, partial [Geminicoccaceae bacterium]